MNVKNYLPTTQHHISENLDLPQITQQSSQNYWSYTLRTTDLIRHWIKWKDDCLYAGIHALLPWCDKSLNVSSNYVSVLHVPSAIHVISKSQQSSWYQSVHLIFQNLYYW